MVKMRLFCVGSYRGAGSRRINCSRFMTIAMPAVMRYQRLARAHVENNAGRGVFGDQGTYGKRVTNTRRPTYRLLDKANEQIETAAT